ncbi:hypothetical protein H6A66_10940 [Bacteroides caecigallinarum]|nr:hypothetical protein [Bacteroides caecigallinarum]MBM6865678.1 hypothetical protein [Bacteroides caecigallinarum]
MDQEIACVHGFCVPPFGEYASGRKFGFFGHDVKNVVEQFSLAHCSLSFLCARQGGVFLSLKKRPAATIAAGRSGWRHPV